MTTRLIHGLAAWRRSNPTDDLTSALVNVEIDGETLSDCRGAHLCSPMSDDTTGQTIVVSGGARGGMR